MLVKVGSEHEFYTAMLVLVISSIVLQVRISFVKRKYSPSFSVKVILGAMFLILGGIDINEPEHHKTADILNNTTTVLVFIITFINVIISGFGFQHSGLMAFDKPKEI